jgi:hypothetical protein
MRRIALLAILILVSQTVIATTVPQASTGQSSSKAADSIEQEVYTGQAVGGDTEDDIVKGDLGDRTTAFTLELKGHTSAEDIEGYARILRKEGQDGLFGALEKKNLGYFRLDGEPDRIVIFAQETQDEAGARSVRVLCERWLNSVVEGFEDRDSDFPFAYVELSLDQDGNGEGTMFMAASVRFGNRTANVLALNDHTALVTISNNGSATIGVQESANNADFLREVRLTNNGPIQQ